MNVPPPQPVQQISSFTPPFNNAGHIALTGGGGGGGSGTVTSITVAGPLTSSPSNITDAGVISMSTQTSGGTYAVPTQLTVNQYGLVTGLTAGADPNAPTGVTAATYVNPASITVDASGKIHNVTSNASVVTQLVAGSNVTLNPSGGTGIVTINATGGSGGVNQLVAGTNVTLSPTNGLGTVTINAAGGSGGVTQLIAGSGIGVSPSGGTGVVTLTATGGGGGSGTVTNIATAPRLTGGPITSTGTLDLAPSGVTAGVYTDAFAMTVNTYGQITSMATGVQGYFNVKTYGAVCNGSTDDTTAIQTAVTAAQAVGGTVFFPGGLSHITATIQVTGNCNFLGANNKTCGLYQSNPNLDAIYVHGSSLHCSLDSLYFSYNIANTTSDVTGTGHAFHYALTGSGGSTEAGGEAYSQVFRNCFIYNCPNGFYLDGCIRWTISGCNFFGSATYGQVNSGIGIVVANTINVDNGDSNITSCYLQGWAIDIQQLGSGGLRIENNKFNPSTKHISQSLVGGTSDLFIVGNSFENAIQNTIELNWSGTPPGGQNSPFISNVIITGNEIQAGTGSSPAYGIAFNTAGAGWTALGATDSCFACNQVVITGNNFCGAYSGSNGAAIFLDSVSNFLIADNILSPLTDIGSSLNGLVIGAHAKYGTIREFQVGPGWPSATATPTVLVSNASPGPIDFCSELKASLSGATVTVSNQFGTSLSLEINGILVAPITSPYTITDSAFGITVSGNYVATLVSNNPYGKVVSTNFIYASGVTPFPGGDPQNEYAMTSATYTSPTFSDTQSGGALGTFHSGAGASALFGTGSAEDQVLIYPGIGSTNPGNQTSAQYTQYSNAITSSSFSVSMWFQMGTGPDLFINDSFGYYSALVGTTGNVQTSGVAKVAGNWSIFCSDQGAGSGQYTYNLYFQYNYAPTTNDQAIILLPGTTTNMTTPNIMDGQWFHIVATFTPSIISGVGIQLVCTPETGGFPAQVVGHSTSAAFVTAPAPGAMSTGARVNPANSQLYDYPQNIGVEGVCYFDYALTPSEINSLYSAGRTIYA